MMHFVSVIVFFLSALFGPWWLMSISAVFLLAEWRDWFSVLLGAFVADLLFGVPIIEGFDLPFLYTGIFSLLILAEFHLRSRILD